MWPASLDPFSARPSSQPINAAVITQFHVRLQPMSAIEVSCVPSVPIIIIIQQQWWWPSHLLHYQTSFGVGRHDQGRSLNEAATNDGSRAV
jgi:hypothetical protein